MQEQCNQDGNAEERGAPTIHIGRRRFVLLAHEVIPILSVEQLGAAVIALDWIEHGPGEVTPQSLAERIGSTVERAAEILDDLHEAGIIAWEDEAPAPLTPPPPPPLPVIMRSTRRGPDHGGAWPPPDLDAFPADGDFAYVLWCSGSSRPRYVGSTGDLRGRLHAHAGNGRAFDRWEAFRCVDRPSAYAFEHHLNIKLRPTDNPRSDTSARSAYARAVSA